MNSKIASTVLDSTTGDVVPKPRSDQTMYLVLPPGGAIMVSYPSYSSHSEACDVAKVEAEETGVPYVVYEARPLDRFEREVKRVRLGRVRRGQP